jgi:hypothetical protein
MRSFGAREARLSNWQSHFGWENHVSVSLARGDATEAASAFTTSAVSTLDTSPAVCGCLACTMSSKALKADAADQFGGGVSSAAPSGDSSGPQFAGDDIADNTSTTTVLNIGSSISSSIQSSGDLDYFRVTLTAGQTYTFSLEGSGLADAYLELRDSAGTLIAENDDGGILLNSFLMYRAASSGTFYVVARGFDGSSTGSYTLSSGTVTQGNTSPTNFTPNSHPFYSWDEAAIQITRSGASWAPGFSTSVTITYAFRSTAPSTMPTDTGGFTRFSAAQIAAAEAALAAWASVANITFVRVNDGDGYSNSASILFGNYSTGEENAAAFAYLPSSGNTSASSVQGDVWINSTLSYNINPVIGEYGQQVLLHEIGHALGLSHPADYNAGTGSPTYTADAVYFGDSRMFTAMSYFASSNTGGVLPAYASLPQLNDIAAIQRLYGANLASRAGDTIYGFNSNTGVPEYSLTLATQGAVFAVWDGGGLDTLDLSGYSTASTIDLREEAFSSAGPNTPGGAGLAVFNISIARGAVIENAVGGNGEDIITGNAANNRLTGNGGNDALYGGAGVDTSVYSSASTSATWTRNASGAWTVTGNGTDTLTGIEVLDFTDRDVVLDIAQQTFSGDGTSDILWRSTSGSIARWDMLGASVTNTAIIGGVGAEWQIRGTGDFNGDGRDDILWRNTSGLLAIWNSAESSQASFVSTVSNTWAIAGVGDFNFDGRDDFLWRNTSDGAVAIWTMNGSTPQTMNIISSAPLDWSIVGVADFNGDGRDEILWRHTSGLLANWSTNGVAQTSASIIGNVPTQWAVAGTGDFDGDGRADILWRNSSDGAAAIWTMNGTTQLGAAIVGAAPLAWSIADVGDYNGDGRDDILWRHTDGSLALWTMNGLAVSNATVIGVIPTEWGIV